MAVKAFGLLQSLSQAITLIVEMNLKEFFTC